MLIIGSDLSSDTCGVPETAVGAMENWGLIIYHEDRIFYTPEENPSKSLIESADTIAHEITHQVGYYMKFKYNYMVNWCLITYNKDRVFYSTEKKTQANSLIKSVDTIVHEIMNQVGCFLVFGTHAVV